MSGAEEKRLLCEESHVRITFSCSSLHFVTISNIEIHDVIAQLLDWWVMLHSCVWRYVQVWGNGCTCYIPSRPTLGELQLLFFFSWGMLRNQCKPVCKWMSVQCDEQRHHTPDGVGNRHERHLASAAEGLQTPVCRVCHSFRQINTIGKCSWEIGQINATGKCSWEIRQINAIS